ncbi:NIPSNAP family protein [Paucibacter sp. APW11]|uniref:NIPSNAP family protein n=1 Tax=Roseateles aquae TaxID=3077235 RepID=A0ABU3P8M1_9BURK|nr:NIPSNAP family protein [Paucibacter sp. APW11]MDT8998096.1 NIPSNAP family protein [Paucibacter sp. APW11]
MGAALIELRQYRCRPGQRDAMMAMFEHHFRPAYAQAGARILGSFAAQEQPDLWVWLRAFDTPAARPAVLERFYGGAVWRQHGQACNALLADTREARLLRLHGGCLDQALDASASRYVLRLWRPRAARRAAVLQALEDSARDPGYALLLDCPVALALAGQRRVRRGPCVLSLQRWTEAIPPAIPATEERLTALCHLPPLCLTLQALSARQATLTPNPDSTEGAHRG